MSEKRPRFVLFDVDGVIADGRLAPACAPRPGIRQLVDLLICLGFEVVLWSAGGAEHARGVAEHIGIHGAVRRCYGKPEYPMSEEAALAVVGGRPALQVDDDPTERVADWPFFHIEGWYGEPEHASEERLAEMRRDAPHVSACCGAAMQHEEHSQIPYCSRCGKDCEPHTGPGRMPQRARQAAIKQASEMVRNANNPWLRRAKGAPDA